MDRASFERPYGLAWLLTLAAELRRWDDPEGKQWLAALEPLEAEAARRIKSWIPKLHYTIRVGEHDQTAFSFGLIWDWAGVAKDAELRALLADAAHRFYESDRDCPLRYEPSGEDFLSPCLGEADFMRRFLSSQKFEHWLTGFLPMIPDSTSRKWLEPAVVTDRGDPKLAHLDGLNLSPAWMLEGIAQGLPAGDPRVLSPARHRQAPPGGGPARGERRALRGRPLAGHLRRLPDQRGGAASGSLKRRREPASALEAGREDRIH